MRPFDLTPGEVKAAKPAGGAPNMGLIGVIGALVLAVVGIGGYFAFAHVDSLKSQTAQAQAETADLQAQEQALQAQIAEAGQEVGNANREVADSLTQMTLASYAERRDYVKATRELVGIMEGTGGWYAGIDVATVTEDEPYTVSLEGYMPSEEGVTSLVKRVEATNSFEGADLKIIRSEVAVRELGGEKLRYWFFTISADLVDPGNAASDPALVGDGGEGGGVEGVAVTPEPPAAGEGGDDTTASEPEEPPNAFAAAAESAAGGTA